MAYLLLEETGTEEVLIETRSGVLQCRKVGLRHMFFVDRLLLDDVCRFAPAIQNDPLFPEGVNVGVAKSLTLKRFVCSVGVS